MRLDKYIVDNNLSKSRTLASDAIKDGRVLVNNKTVTKSSYILKEDDIINIISSDIAFVSRAGLKLYHALKSFNINLSDRIVMDVGASTGGFSDVALKEGAKKIYALDVGTDQLVDEIKNNDKVINMENINARYLDATMFDEFADFVCMDVSFISIKLIIPAILQCIKEDYEMVVLIKPQFEAGKNNMGKNGVIKDPKVHKQVLLDMINFMNEQNIHVANLDVSSILGRDGNKEFVMHLNNNHELNKVCFDLNEIIKKDIK